MRKLAGKPETALQAAILMALRAMPGVSMERNAQKHTTHGRFGLEEGSAQRSESGRKVSWFE